MKVFLYDNRLDLGKGILAQVDGFKLTYISHTFFSSPEAIRYDKKSIYGYIYEIGDDMIEALDAYYGVGIGLHNKIEVEAHLEGGIIHNVIMYECVKNIEYNGVI